jgi:hypothetical protein
MFKFLRFINYRNTLWFLFYFFLFALLLKNSAAYLDPDLGWHLKVGQIIAQTQTVPRANTFNYVVTGDWVDHEWLSNLGSFWVYQQFGYPALTLAFVGLIILTLIILQFFVKSAIVKSNATLIMIFEGLGLSAALPSLGVRMQEVGLLLLLLLLIILNHYSKYKQKKVLLGLLPLFFFWSCLHASFLIGLFLLLAWLLVKIGENILYRWWPHLIIDWSGRLGARELWPAAGLFLATFLTTLLTPYKWDLYGFLLGYKNSVYMSYIQEWLSQFSFPFYYQQLFYLALVVLAGLIYLYYAVVEKKLFKLNLWQLFLWVLFVVLAFKSRRHFPLMFIATFWLVIKVYSTILEFSGHYRPRWWLKFFLLTCFVTVIVSTLIQIKPINQPFQAYCQDYPCAAADFLKNHHSYDSHRLLNNYGWGGYLIWANPARQLFIDGRLPQVLVASHSYLEEYLEFFSTKSDIGAKLQSYQISLVLLPTQDKKVSIKLWEKIFFGITDADLNYRNYLREYLTKSADWGIIFQDQVSTIYAKK